MQGVNMRLVKTLWIFFISLNSSEKPANTIVDLEEERLEAQQSLNSSDLADKDESSDDAKTVMTTKSRVSEIWNDATPYDEDEITDRLKVIRIHYEKNRCKSKKVKSNDALNAYIEQEKINAQGRRRSSLGRRSYGSNESIELLI
jgi:hypothetical protein